MAFYDDMKRKITKTKDDVVQKTSNYTEISRLNTSISTLEKDVDNAYRDIGRIYYNEYVTDTENINSSILPLFNRITENLKTIEEYRQEIYIKKGLRICPECKMEIPVNAAYCNYCGAKQPPIINTVRNSRICPKCGSPCDEEQVYCTNCGYKLEIIEPKEERYCANCGNVLEEDAAFCMVCGQKWEEEKLEEEINEEIEEEREIKNDMNEQTYWLKEDDESKEVLEQEEKGMNI